MANDDAKLRLICDERAGLRQTILAMQGSMHQATFAFVTAAGVGVSLIWNKDALAGAPRGIVLFTITQAEFLLCVFVIGLLAHQDVATDYIAALEARINELCGVTVNVFESKIARRFYSSPRGAFLWAQCLIFLFLLSVFIVMGNETISSVPAARIVLPVEIIVFLGLVYAVLRQRPTVREEARKALGCQSP